MTVREIIALVPDAADIMSAYGLHCFSCAVGGVETLEEGVAMHGWETGTLETLLVDLNEALVDQPERPQTLTLTENAAKELQEIAKLEKREQEHLIVTLDQEGAFCMEFQENIDTKWLQFQHTNVQEMPIFASPLTLARIGGATIDIREGRFKLDLPEDACCKETKGGSCCKDHN